MTLKRSEIKRSAPMSRGISTLKAKAPMTKKPAPERKVRMRKCAIATCRTPFAPRSMTHKTCSPECALILVDQDKAKAARKERQAGLAKLKRRADWMKEAQTAFNAFIRERDADKPCICCGRIPKGDHVTGGTWDAGHYRSVGSAPHLRFNEMNVHRQMKQCNQWGAGRAVDYRIGLVARIGLPLVEMLESDNAPRKYSIEELQSIKKTYQQKLKELRASRKHEHSQSEAA